jgi:hypothetical protein
MALMRKQCRSYLEQMNSSPETGSEINKVIITSDRLIALET